MTFDLEKNEFNYVFHQFDYLFKDMDGARFHEGEVIGILHGAKKDGITPGADYVYRFIQGLQERVILEKKRNMHQKYKRCLAMAMWCDAEADVADADGDYDDMKWYQKWHKRWLELAEKFKSNSTAQ